MRLTTTLLGLSCSVLLAAGCGGGAGTCDPSTAMGTDYKFATNKLLLPVATSYAIDIDGDGHADNALKMLLSPLAGMNIDIQGSVDTALKNGEAVVLADVKTSDLTTSTCSSTKLALALKPANPPKFDGTDTFMVDPAAAASALGGTITGGVINTTLPINMGPSDSTVPTITLQLAIAGGNLSLRLYGVHIQGTLSASGVMSGQLHGVVLKKDIDGSIIPAVAMLITGQINKDPTSNTSKTIIGIFEDMTQQASMDKCNANMNDCCATHPMSCKILASEVASSLVGSLLAPDVGMHDGSGNWKPAKANAKDALSVGLGFTTVKASF